MSGIDRLLRLGPDWNRPHPIPLETYLAIHDSHMRSLENQLLVEDRISIDTANPFSIRISGNVNWVPDERQVFPRLIVDKTLVWTPNGLVQGSQYHYQACVCTATSVFQIFRYDNTHPHTGHDDSYHAHWLADGTDVVIWIGQHRWPELHKVIRCFDEWWKEDGYQRSWDDGPGC